MAKSSSSGETKAPLVIALVFFVLATIGLGVFAYTTNEDLTAAKGAAAEAAKTKSAADASAQKAREEALMYKAALGILSEADRTALGGISQYKADAKKVYDDMAAAFAAKANQSIQDQTKNFVGGGAAFSAVPADVLVWSWNGTDAPQPPSKSVIDAAVAAMAQRELNDRTTKTAQNEMKTQTASMIQITTARDAAEKAFKDETRAIPGKVAAEADKIKKGYDDKAKEFVTQQGESRNTVQTVSDKLAERDVLISRKDQRIAAQERRLDELLDRQMDLIDPFQFDKPQGRILRRYSDSLVDIDLGNTDKLRPGIAFSVFPSDTVVRGMQPRMRAFKDPDGKTAYKPIPKGKIEVIDVLGPNIAQCRIIDEDNSVRDRVIPGDLLYNALWRKGTSEHVALFGVFDLDGDGRDDTQALIAGLRRLGVVVDAYYDLAKLKWEGEITSQTNFGVEGYYPTVMAADGNREAKIKVLNGIGDARKAVKDKGIMILRPRDFFPRIGFNARLDVNEDAINQAATGFARAQADSKPAAAPAPEGAPAPMADPKKN